MKHFNVLVALLLAIFITPVFDKVEAQTVMKEGTITTAPWLNKYYRMKVDGIVYTFMPTVQIDAYFTDYDPQEMSSYLAGKFRVGDKVNIAKQGFRIYRVEFLEK